MSVHQMTKENSSAMRYKDIRMKYGVEMQRKCNMQLPVTCPGQTICRKFAYLSSVIIMEQPYWYLQSPAQLSVL